MAESEGKTTLSSRNRQVNTPRPQSDPAPPFSVCPFAVAMHTDYRKANPVESQGPEYTPSWQPWLLLQCFWKAFALDDFLPVLHNPHPGDLPFFIDFSRARMTGGARNAYCLSRSFDSF